MVGRRMVSTELPQSSVFFRAAEKYEDDIEQTMACQLFFLALILKADDYGRGKIIFKVLRAKAFVTIPELMLRYSDDKNMEWLRLYEDDKAIEIYTDEARAGTDTEAQLYYRLCNWQYYQRGNWRPRASRIPPSPQERDGKVWRDKDKKEGKDGK